MAVLHDLICRDCGDVEVDQLVRVGALPPCHKCGGERTWIPFAPHTDVYGTPVFSEASGQYHTSRRDMESHMKSLGYEPCGDKVGGAREVQRIKNATFSYPGQGSRTTGTEREVARTKNYIRERGGIDP